jgi:hypothetical protein
MYPSGTSWASLRTTPPDAPRLGDALREDEGALSASRETPAEKTVLAVEEPWNPLARALAGKFHTELGGVEFGVCDRTDTAAAAAFLASTCANIESLPLFSGGNNASRYGRGSCACDPAPEPPRRGEIGNRGAPAFDGSEYGKCAGGCGFCAVPRGARREAAASSSRGRTGTFLGGSSEARIGSRGGCFWKAPRIEETSRDDSGTSRRSASDGVPIPSALA